MKPIEDLLPRIQAFAPAAPEPVMIGCLRDAGITFLKRTRLWKHTELFAVTPTGCRQLFAPANSQIDEILSARFQGEPLEAVTLTQLDELSPNWRLEPTSDDDEDDEEEDDDEDVTGQPQWISQLSDNSVVVVPGATGDLSVTLSLFPTQSADKFPDFCIDKYGEEISWGAIAAMLIKPQVDWANPQLAAVFEQRWQMALDRLSPKGTKGQQRAPARSRGSWF
jgi:hypothetical protein